jgi:TatD DNase family protein
VASTIFDPVAIQAGGVDGAGRFAPVTPGRATARWTDDHCHLPPGSEGDKAVADALAAGVERLITVGTDRAGSEAAIAVAQRHPGAVWATVGLHPHDAKDGLDGLAELLGEPEVVAVGECGLDYHYDHSPREVQRASFAAQIGLAHEHGLPLVVHTREAWDDTIAVLRSEGVPERTVVHCFTGGPAEAAACLELGAHLSFSGIVTFKGAPEVREAARRCPPERLLVETDSPFLAPEPHRGRPNRPALVTVVGARVAAERGVPDAEIAALTWENAARVYGLG